MPALASDDLRPQHPLAPKRRQTRQAAPPGVPAAGDPMTKTVQLRLIKLAGGERNWDECRELLPPI
jgi:hypothetical protein